MANAQVGLQLKIFSPTDDLLGIISDTDETGSLLDIVIEEQEVGGVHAFSFKVKKDLNIPITENAECYFYISGTLWFIGYVVDVPQQDQDELFFLISGNGFYRRLEKKVINDNYTTETLLAIIQDVGPNYLGADVNVFYNATKIDVPTINNITIEFKDKNLLDVYSTLLKIANNDWANAKYRFYVDNEKDLVFEQISETIVKNLFEGYDFQFPEVTQDTSNLINKVLTFRTTVADPKTAEFVAIYEDTESQGKYGIFEKKITFPDFADTTTISNIANAILNRWADPITRMQIKDIPIFQGIQKFSEIGILNDGGGDELWLVDPDGSSETNILLRSERTIGLDEINFGLWALSNKRDLYWNLISECDSLTGWDVSNLSNTVLTVDTARVLTGKRALKFAIGASSLGEYAEFTLDRTLFFPQELRFYIYFDTTQISIKFIVVDVNDAEVEFELDLDLTNEWQVILKQLGQTVDPDGFLTVIENGGGGFLLLDFDSSNQGQNKIRHQLVAGANSIKSVKIGINSNTATTMYMDRIEVSANNYKYHELLLKQVRYNLSSIGSFAELAFGERVDSVIDEINGKIKDGNVALKIFSKQ